MSPDIRERRAEPHLYGLLAYGVFPLTLKSGRAREQAGKSSEAIQRRVLRPVARCFADGPEIAFHRGRGNTDLRGGRNTDLLACPRTRAARGEGALGGIRVAGNSHSIFGRRCEHQRPPTIPG